MKLNLYQVDAFTDKIFGGNPACVVPLEDWLPDIILLQIAKENAVAETAFFIDKGDRVHLRWFTPEIEMDLCGHATLATAHCLKTIMDYPKDEIIFETQSGDLTVSCGQNNYTMDFPARMPTPADLPTAIAQALNIVPQEVHKARDYLLVYATEEDVKNISINRHFFDQINLDPGGVIVTAPGSDCDFVSRFFTPQSSILEDPVTGSAHCTLTPFWAERLNKTHLSAMQVSSRLGILHCTQRGSRVLIKGQARTYSMGTLWTQ